jgi:Fe2+ or Zn2+ uptake regulation protein
MAHEEADTLLIDKLRERHQRVTSQRLVIFRAVHARRQHLTAEQVLDAVSPALPGIAMPTVYATLLLLEELDLVRRVSTGTGAVLFDSRVTPHAHTVCRGCGALGDLEAPGAPPEALQCASDAGFSPDHAQLLIWGLCAACKTVVVAAAPAV